MTAPRRTPKDTDTDIAPQKPTFLMLLADLGVAYYRWRMTCDEEMKDEAEELEAAFKRARNADPENPVRPADATGTA